MAPPARPSDSRAYAPSLSSARRPSHEQDLTPASGNAETSSESSDSDGGSIVGMEGGDGMCFADGARQVPFARYALMLACVLAYIAWWLHMPQEPHGSFRVCLFKSMDSIITLAFFLILEFLRRERSVAARLCGVLFLYRAFATLRWAFFPEDSSLLPRAMVSGLQLLTLSVVYSRLALILQAYAEGGDRALALSFGLMGLFEAVIPVVEELWDRPAHHTGLWVGRYVGHAVTSVAAAVASSWTFSPILRQLRASATRLRGKYALAEAAWARRVLWRAYAALVVICATSSLMWCTSAAAPPWINLLPFWRHLNIGMDVIYISTEFLAVLALTADPRLLQPTLRAAEGCVDSAAAALQPGPEGQVRSEAWLETTRRLAGRSISASEVLAFYQRLGAPGGGGLLPGFDPLRHTTNDVVRGALIPATRHGDGGFAYADLLAAARGADAVDGGLPQRMVTHDWQNLFSHLVAAVLADALGWEEYGQVAKLLANGGSPRLIKELAARGTAGRRYWICAFCVNQHASICGHFSPEPPEGTPHHDRWDANRRDTVTGKLHKTCSCSEPKRVGGAWWDLCEFNKFDDMMFLMQQQMPDLRQTIAIDVDMGLFTRVWCVAELVQASASGIPQDAFVFSKQVFDANQGDAALYAKLATLTVADCSATCQEDKERILAKIQDVSQFDAQLHALIFGSSGLMGRHLRGFDVLYTAARTAFRLKMAASTVGAYP